ncbi:MAG: hypothetical protein GX309_10525 [Clostridiales bacterium]|nr:hypothetical protein [Clostridiales bacterium]
MVNYILIALYLAFTLAGVFLFKIGCNKEFLVSISTGIFSLHISLISILGLISYVISFLMYMFLISKFDMTYIVPVTTGINYILTFIFAVMIFKESITVNKILGSMLILIGVIIINIKK